MPSKFDFENERRLRGGDASHIPGVMGSMLGDGEGKERPTEEQIAAFQQYLAGEVDKAARDQEVGKVAAAEDAARIAQIRLAEAPGFVQADGNNESGKVGKGSRGSSIRAHAAESSDIVFDSTDPSDITRSPAFAPPAEVDAPNFLVVEGEHAAVLPPPESEGDEPGAPVASSGSSDAPDAPVTILAPEVAIVVGAESFLAPIALPEAALPGQLPASIPGAAVSVAVPDGGAPPAAPASDLDPEITAYVANRKSQAGGSDPVTSEANASQTLTPEESSETVTLITTHNAPAEPKAEELSETLTPLDQDEEANANLSVASTASSDQTISPLALSHFAEGHAKQTVSPLGPRRAPMGQEAESLSEAGLAVAPAHDDGEIPAARLLPSEGGIEAGEGSLALRPPVLDEAEIPHQESADHFATPRVDIHTDSDNDNKVNAALAPKIRQADIPQENESRFVVSAQDLDVQIDMRQREQEPQVVNVPGLDITVPADTSLVVVPPSPSTQAIGDQAQPLVIVMNRTEPDPFAPPRIYLAPPMPMDSILIQAPQDIRLGAAGGLLNGPKTESEMRNFDSEREVESGSEPEAEAEEGSGFVITKAEHIDDIDDAMMAAVYFSGSPIRTGDTGQSTKRRLGRKHGGEQGSPLTEELISLVSRMLVSADPNAEKPELRVMLDEALMPGAEVRFKIESGTLRVTLYCITEEDGVVLEAEAHDLAEALRGTTELEVTVDVICAAHRGKG